MLFVPVIWRTVVSIYVMKSRWLVRKQASTQLKPILHFEQFNMFWEQLKSEEGNFSDMLKMENMTVENVLNHPSTAQEVKFMPEDLFDFFKTKERLSELLHFALNVQSDGNKERCDTAVQILKSNNCNFVPLLLGNPENVNYLYQFLENDQSVDWFSLSMFCSFISAIIERCPAEVVTMVSGRKELFALLLKHIPYPVAARLAADFIMLFSTKRELVAPLGQTFIQELLGIEKLPDLLCIPGTQLSALFEQLFLQWREHLFITEDTEEIPQIRTVLSAPFIDQVCSVISRPGTLEESSFPYASEYAYVQGCEVLCSIIRIATTLRDFRQRRLAASRGNILASGPVYDEAETFAAIVQRAEVFFKVADRAHEIRLAEPNLTDSKPPFPNAYFATLRLLLQLGTSGTRDIDEEFACRVFIVINELYFRYCMSCYALSFANSLLIQLSFASTYDGSRELTPFLGILLTTGRIFKFILEVREHCLSYKKERGRLPASYDFIMPIAAKVDDILKDGISSFDQLPDFQPDRWGEFVESELKAHIERNASLLSFFPTALKVAEIPNPVPQVGVREMLAKQRSEFRMELMSERIPEMYGISAETLDEDSDAGNKFVFRTPKAGCFVVLQNDTLSLNSAVDVDEKEDEHVSCSVPSSLLASKKSSLQSCLRKSAAPWKDESESKSAAKVHFAPIPDRPIDRLDDVLDKTESAEAPDLFANFDDKSASGDQNSLVAPSD
uniref:Serine/threonine-protein phosphatase 4 regulatory subunit 3-like central domain-containing protein n=1 Tax=Trichuris muris TaxID=70415 RepID=A0A5S6QCU7_TRIMR